MEITAIDLINTLTIDSIFGVLSWYERTTIHLYLSNKISPEDMPEKVTTLATVVKENKIVPPQMKIGQDRLKYYLQEYRECEFLDLANEWLQVEEYLKYHPEITQEIKKITI
jgi:predicted ArsR family transcriptional regulator